MANQDKRSGNAGQGSDPAWPFSRVSPRQRKDAQKNTIGRRRAMRQLILVAFVGLLWLTGPDRSTSQGGKGDSKEKPPAATVILTDTVTGFERLEEKKV